jgi:hypothetical protein
MADRITRVYLTIIRGTPVISVYRQSDGPYVAPPNAHARWITRWQTVDRITNTIRRRLSDQRRYNYNGHLEPTNHPDPHIVPTSNGWAYYSGH